jgi:hypothetical protein
MHENIAYFQALLDNGTYTFNQNLRVTFPIGMRRDVRNQLLISGMQFNEQKYALSSDFILYIRDRMDARVYIRLAEYILEVQAQQLVSNARLEREEAQQKNKFRKYTFRSALPVPFEGMDDDEILRRARKLMLSQ